MKYGPTFGRGHSFHLQIESQRVGRDTFDTYYLMGVHTAADGEVTVIDHAKDSDLSKIRELAKRQAQSSGCFVKEDL